MGILDVFKKKEKPPEPKAPPLPELQVPSEVPINEVITMQQQGLTNNQIVQALQRKGYAPNAIYDALAQAEAKQTMGPAIQQPPGFPEQPGFMEPAAMGARGAQAPFEAQTQPPIAQHPDTEALIEKIVEEKWNDMQKEHGKFSEWKDSINSRVDKIEQQIKDLRADLDGLHKAIVARVSDYDKTLMDVGTEVKAMEKVFQKVLPELTENIQELSRITKSTKQKQAPKKSTTAKKTD
ncbi:hypothetical protein D6825_04040 [Candidatus Woesearchaeota archaeon]|nr:MAG: hypothetical protein D6825_04040 [Candidatus Woesearchaeota archaeon]